MWLGGSTPGKVHEGLGSSSWSPSAWGSFMSSREVLLVSIPLHLPFPSQFVSVHSKNKIKIR